MVLQRRKLVSQNLRKRLRVLQSKSEHQFRYKILHSLLISTSWYKLIIITLNVTKGAHTAHMCVWCHFKMPFLPGINRFHNPLRRLRDRESSLSRYTWLLQTGILAATQCNATYVSAQSTLHRRPTLIGCKV